MKRLVTTIATLSLLILASRAQAAGDKIVIGIGVMHSTADLAFNNGADYNAAYDHSELGGRFEYWNMMRENYALNFQANIGFFSETDKPGPGAGSSAAEGKYTQSSWSVRLGGDRVWSPLEHTKMFMGPGLEFWSGKAKFENIGPLLDEVPNTYETENVNRFSLHGHVGSITMLGPNWGISGQLGHRIGVASYKEGGAKTTWWPSSLDGAMELVFSFGGK